MGGALPGNRSASLAEAVAAVRRRHGAAALRRGGEPLAAASWSTGMPAVDRLAAAGGLPCGRLVVLVGDPRGSGGSRRAAARPGDATGRLTLLQAMAAAASRAMQVVYVDLPGTLDPGFLAGLGADLAACLVVRPGDGMVASGLVMARALVGAGVPWLGVALGPRGWRGVAAEPVLAALVGAVERAKAVACISAPAPLPVALAHASSLTIACVPLGWQREHGDVAGLRVRLQVAKSKVGVPEGETSLLLRYPRPHGLGEVVGLPAVVTVGSPDMPQRQAAADTAELPAAAG